MSPSTTNATSASSGFSKSLRLRKRQRLRIGQIGIGRKAAVELGRDIVERLLRLRHLRAQARDQRVVALSVRLPKLGGDAFVERIEACLQILLPPHQTRDRIVAGAEAGRHLRQRGARFCLMRPLRRAEGLIPGGSSGLPSETRQIASISQGSISVKRLNCALPLRVERGGGEPQPRQAIRPFALAAINVGEIDQGCDGVLMARPELVLRDRQRPVEPAARLGQIAGLEVEQRDSAQIFDQLRMRAADHALVDLEAAHQIWPGLVRLAGIHQGPSERTRRKRARATAFAELALHHR